MSNPDAVGVIYKVVSDHEWAAAKQAGVYTGSAVDIQDGFIHLSSADQLKETVSKHFAGQTDLLLLAVEAESLGETLKWEPSRGGALFPHVYGNLPLSAVRSAEPLPLSDDGNHVFPDRIESGGDTTSP